MTYSHILFGASTGAAVPVVRRLAPSDLFHSLARGVDDFVAMPSHAIFLCVIYPLLGILLVSMTLGNSLLPLAFPIAAGFALVGPLAAIGLYELSRRREAGLDSSPSHVFDVLHSPSLGAIVALGLLLMAIFLIWLAVAQGIYIANFGYKAPVSIRQFADDALNTSAGWNLILSAPASAFCSPWWCSRSAPSRFRCSSTATSARRQRCSPRSASSSQIRVRWPCGASSLPRSW